MDRNKVLTKLQKSGHRPRTSPGLVIDIEYTENGGTYSSLSDWLINTTVVGIKILLSQAVTYSDWSPLRVMSPNYKNALH